LPRIDAVCGLTLGREIMKGKNRSKGTLVAVLILLLSAAPVHLVARDVFPAKPITIIIANPPGASLDITTRAISAYMGKYLNTNVIISNVPGANGDIGTTKAYTAKPDGYTLTAWMTMQPLLTEYMKTVKFKTLKFTPIAAISRDYPILVGHPEGIKNIETLVKQAKTRSVSIGNNGQFTTHGFQGRLMAEELGMKVNWVNFSGAAEAMTALAGKHIDAATTLTATAMPLVKAGKIVPLLIFAKHRIPQYPETPVPSELKFDIPLLSSLLGIVGPPGMDKEKVKILEDAIRKGTKSTDYLSWMEKASTAEPIFLSADGYKAEIEELAKVAEKYKSFLTTP